MDELIFRVARKTATPDEVEAVRLWRQASPLNDQRYRELIEILALATVAEELRAKSPVPPVARLLKQSTLRRSPALLQRWTIPLGAAALLLLGFSVARLVQSRSSSPSFAADEFVTGASDMATVRLNDGTIVRLAPSSRLHVIPGTEGREVSLEGHAYFAVAKAHGRPFAVRTAAGDAQVLGTRFEINVKERDLRLVVVEGLVSLSAGHQTVAVPARHMSRVVDGTARPAVDLSSHAADDAVRWTGRLLVFQDRRLQEAIEEIRQQYGAKIVLADPSLADETVTAWFQDRSFEDVMKVVCAVLGARCSIEPGQATIDRRPSGTASRT